jgi:hypothetical protein
MATIQCTVDYVNGQVQTTYRIIFDRTDKLNVVSHTPQLTLRANGSSGSAVQEALNNRGVVPRNTTQLATGEVTIEVPMAQAATDGKFGTLDVTLDDLVNFNLVHFECSGPGWNASGNNGTRFPEPPFGT